MNSSDPPQLFGDSPRNDLFVLPGGLVRRDWQGNSTSPIDHLKIARWHRAISTVSTPMFKQIRKCCVDRRGSIIQNCHLLRTFRRGMLLELHRSSCCHLLCSLSWIYSCRFDMASRQTRAAVYLYYIQKKAKTCQSQNFAIQKMKFTVWRTDFKNYSCCNQTIRLHNGVNMFYQQRA